MTEEERLIAAIGRPPPVPWSHPESDPMACVREALADARDADLFIREHPPLPAPDDSPWLRGRPWSRRRRP